MCPLPVWYSGIAIHSEGRGYDGPLLHARRLYPRGDTNGGRDISTLAYALACRHGRKSDYTYLGDILWLTALSRAFAHYSREQYPSVLLAGTG